jgi:CRP-like cAMP-binding protein
MSRTANLSQFSFFSDISNEKLADFEVFSMVQIYEKGDVIFQSNEPAKNLYGLVKGDVSLSLIFKEEIVTKDIKYEEYINTNVEIFEKPVTIEKIKNGDIFGWSALVQPERMTATARCEKECEIVVIPASDLKKILSNDPELGYLLSARVSSIIAQRLSSRTEKLVDSWCSLFEAGKISSV